MKYLLIFLMLIFLIGSASAQSSLVVDLLIRGTNSSTANGVTVYGDYSVNFMGAYVVSNRTNTPFSGTANENSALEVQVDGKSLGKTEIASIAAGGSLNSQGSALAILYINYTNAMDSIKILFKGKERMSVSVASLLCDKNAKCENCFVGIKNCTNHYENALSCTDCSASGRDLYCNAAKDGVCDPDCINNADSDCVSSANAGAGQTTENAKSKTGLYVFIAIIILLIVAAAAFVSWRLLRAARGGEEERTEL